MYQSCFRLTHIPALDGIRGVAVLAVALSHAGYVLGAHVGVDMFFVLSGFLITSLILKEWLAANDVSLKRFYLRRALRLGPALMTLLVAACLYETLYRPYPNSQNVFLRALYAIFYITNWIWAFHPAEHLGGLGALAPLWSLAIEEQFYLVWPATFVVLLRRRAKPAHISTILTVLIVASICQRLFLWQAVHPTRAHFGTDSHADPILVGCLLALVVHTVSEQVWSLVRPWLAAAIPFVMAVLLVSIVLTVPGRYAPTMAAICTAMLILSVTVAHARLSLTIFECRILVWLGKISYGLYLWHSVSSLYLQKHGLVESTIASFFIALALALASYYIVERPALKFKGRLSGAGAAPQESWRHAGIFRQLSYPVERWRRKGQVAIKAFQSKQL